MPRAERPPLFHLLLRAALLLFAAWAPAQARAAGFQPMGERRLFQAEVITEVQLDRHGFLWIGTREGLFLHDGQRFRKFQHEIDVPTSISSNAIRGVFEDSRGRLWVNTITGGLNRLDRARWEFQRFRHQEVPGGLSHDGVFALAEAAGGQLWVGTQAGLDLLDPDSGRAQPVALREGGEFVTALLRDRSGRLWVGTLGTGLFRQRDDGHFEAIRSQVPGTAANDIFSLAQDAQGQLWVGTRSGLLLYDAASRGLAQPVLTPSALGDGLVNVTELRPAPDGSIWVGTFGVGLYRLFPRDGRVEVVDLGIAGTGAQNIDQGAVAVDHQGGVIVGTFGAGLRRRAPSVLDIGGYRHLQGDVRGLSNEDVYSLLAEGGAVLAGSFGGGVQRIDPADETVGEAYVPKERENLDGVVTMRRARDGALWVGTSGGLYRRDAQGKAQVFAARSGSPGDAFPGFVYALLEDRAGRIWAGTGGAGLYRYRPERGDFLVYRPRAGDAQALSDDFVSALLEDRRGRLWVGTRSGGLNLCTLQAEQLRCQRLRRESGAAPSYDHVVDLLEAPDGAIWVGTGGGGLNRIALDADGHPQAVRVWTRADGLVDDNVMALARTPDGAMWISTRVGLSRLGPDGRFANYTLVDGLPSAVFNPKAVAELEGRLYWGSTRGIVSIDPRRWSKTGRAAPVVLTAVEGLEAQAPLPAPPWLLRELRVPWRQPFSLEFAVLSFDGGEAEYEYRLQDDEPWIALGDRRQLTLHALPPGHYSASVRGRQSGADWVATPPLAIEVHPPWWRRAWVQGLALTALVAVVVLGLLWRVRALQRRNRELKGLQRQKEAALVEAGAARQRLEAAFARLRRMTMRLEAAKEEERKHLARELHDEFGQALTAAKINLRLATTHPGSPLAEERIGETIDLVERLIAQVRALSFDLRPPLLDDLGLAAALEGYLRGVAQRSGRDIAVALAPDLPRLGAAREIAAFRIVQEAVTNGLRHAEDGHIRVSVQPHATGIEIVIGDNGVGFDAEATLAAAPRGFGLFGMRERVEELGGRWTLASRPGQGTTITAIIPGEPQPPCA